MRAADLQAKAEKHRKETEAARILDEQTREREQYKAKAKEQDNKIYEAQVCCM